MAKPSLIISNHSSVAPSWLIKLERLESCSSHSFVLALLVLLQSSNAQLDQQASGLLFLQI